jgi:O-antigen/teichoic acid export membrane protein
VRKITKNIISLLASDFSNRATTFALYVLVARNLGAFEFGQLSLGLTFFYIFQVAALAGLKVLLTREVSQNLEKADLYLVNGSLIVLLMSTFSLVLLGVVVWLLGYRPDTALLILLLCLGLVPSSLSAICEALFLAWEQMWYIAGVNVFANIIRIGAGFFILVHSQSLFHLIVLLLVCHVLVLIMNWWLIARRISWPVPVTNVNALRELFRASSPFLGIDVVTAVSSSLNVILLSRLTGEVDVGLFNATSQLLVPIALICQSTALSVFPALCQRYDGTGISLQPITERVAELLVAIALPVSIGLWFLAEPTLALLYGSGDFLQSRTILRIAVWSVVLSALTSILGQVILASRHEKATLRIVLVDGLVSLILGGILVWQLGVVGAAISLVCVKLVDFIQHYLVVTNLLGSLRVSKLFWKPGLATVVLAAYLLVAANLHLGLIVVGGILIYAVALGGLNIWSSGGLQQFKAKYSSLWSI